MKYQIQGFHNSTENGYDADRDADTLADAKRQAKYMLSDEYRRRSEAAECLKIAQIWKGNTLIDEIRQEG